VGVRKRKCVRTDQIGQASLHNDVRPRYQCRLAYFLKGKPEELRAAWEEYYAKHPLEAWKLPLTHIGTPRKKGARRG
jgi:hypothetical protein